MSHARTSNAASKRKKLLFVCSEDWYFLSHRMALARAAQVRGWEIVVACRKNQAAEILQAEGFKVIDLNIARGGLSPVSSLKTVAHLIAIFRREKPDVIVNVAIQCVILSTLAGLLGGARRIVNMVTGLGFIFVSSGRKAKIIRSIVCWVLRFYARFKSVQVIVQNADDEELMARLGFRRANLSLIRGSGVDMQTYFPTSSVKDANAAEQPKTAIFVARMLWSKGLGELVAAIRLLAEKGVHYRFLLVGDVDLANPDSATVDDLEGWQKEGLVEWLGKRGDIPTLLQGADLAVLPSWREGLPKSLIEAAACRLAMVATDVPGCREIVRHNDTGLLVKLGDADALADAIERLMENNEFRKSCANNAYSLVEKELCDAVVVQKTLKVIEG